jgi:hypothetical protein
MLIGLDSLQLRYEPYPIGIIRPAMPEERYLAYVDAYPPAQLFQYIPKVGHKYCLSEKYNCDQYKDWIANFPVWKDFYSWIKSNEFIFSVLNVLSERHVDLGFRQRPRRSRLSKRLCNLLRGKWWTGHDRLSARFDFSMLPADGGTMKPHTDNAEKIVTMVISMVRPGEWDPTLGGGLDINRPRRAELVFNHVNKKADFDDMEILHTYEFFPNQGILFIKTFNSWHSVRPMPGIGSKAMRRTLTINIEKRH